MLRRACCGEEPVWDSQCQKHFSNPLCYSTDVRPQLEILSGSHWIRHSFWLKRSCPVTWKNETDILLATAIFLATAAEGNWVVLFGGKGAALYNCPDPFPQDTPPATLPEPLPLHCCDPRAALSFVECRDWTQTINSAYIDPSAKLQPNMVSPASFLTVYSNSPSGSNEDLIKTLNEIGPSTIKNYA